MSVVFQRGIMPTMLAQREQYHRFKPYWTMLSLPVLTSTLGVRWHREHLATSGAANMSNDGDEELEDEDDDEEEWSLVTWSKFCCGTGRGLIGDPWAAAVCIFNRSLAAILVARGGG